MLTWPCLFQRVFHPKHSNRVWNHTRNRRISRSTSLPSRSLWACSPHLTSHWLTQALDWVALQVLNSISSSKTAVDFNLFRQKRHFTGESVAVEMAHCWKAWTQFEDWNCASYMVGSGPSWSEFGKQCTVILYVRMSTLNRVLNLRLMRLPVQSATFCRGMVLVSCFASFLKYWGRSGILKRLSQKLHTWLQRKRTSHWIKVHTPPFESQMTLMFLISACLERWLAKRHMSSAWSTFEGRLQNYSQWKHVQLDNEKRTNLPMNILASRGCSSSLCISWLSGDGLESWSTSCVSSRLAPGDAGGDEGNVSYRVLHARAWLVGRYAV